MPRPLFTPGKDPVPIVQETGWAPGPENLAPTGILSPNRPACSQSLYRLRYPTHGLIGGGGGEICGLLLPSYVFDARNLGRLCNGAVYPENQVNPRVILWQLCILVTRSAHLGVSAGAWINVRPNVRLIHRPGGTCSCVQ